MGVARFLLRRILGGLAILPPLSVLVFAAIEVLPGDAAVYALAGQNPSPELLAQTRHRLGLDRSAPERYLDWLAGLPHGDLGRSAINGQSVSAVIEGRIGNTVVLGVLVVLLMVPLALGIGAFAGTREGRAGDRVVSLVTLCLVAVPEFVLAAALIVVFAFVLDVLPATSIFPVEDSPLAHPTVLVLPVTTLALVAASGASRQVRVGVADVMRSRYVETARLKGLPERRVVLRHVIPNAVGPSLQVLAGSVGVVIGGSVIVETVFSYPGLGSALAAAVTTRDFALVEGIVMLLAAALVAAYTAADLAVALLTPKLRTAL
ncbi:ABC transporter permease [Actinomadura decatromicini]|uniref:ABC transporter permease n=1 Tax=Actinomadura decatromicini TaxID=2604572 RepID=A0A5D3G0R6_9ACTN|nr:ABC transporter permease [Actinomadura decatromicini]TYK53085.1 ABC transporter permease [Actinomadura decatromicini]